MYIWQARNWPHFIYQSSRIKPKLRNALAKQQQLIGKALDLPEELDRQSEMDALIQNALQTSEIEGEKLNIGSVRSSVARYLGLEQAGLPRANYVAKRPCKWCRNMVIMKPSTSKPRHSLNYKNNLLTLLTGLMQIKANMILSVWH